MPVLLLSLALLSFGDEKPPKVWVERLGSSNPAERFEAIDALDALGPRALPALREAAGSGEGEARRSAAERIERIGDRRLLRPTTVTLELGGSPVPEAVAALATAGGFSLALDPQGLPKWKEKAVDLQTGGPIGFFEALDRLGAAGGFLLNPSPHFAQPSASGIRIRLVPFDRPIPPTSYAGPYRLSLTDLNRHREVLQARNPAENKPRETFTAKLEIAAEPGILIDRNGSIRLYEAVDDRGRDLRPASTADPSNSFTLRQWSQEQISLVSYSLPLQLPEERSRTIARLRGYAPITAVARLDEIFSVPVEGLEGKTLGGASVQFHVVRAMMTPPALSLDITVRGNPPTDPQSFASGPRQATLATIKLGYNPDDHLRLEDANGIPYASNSNITSPPQPDGTMSFRINFYAHRPCGPPAKLRYFGVAAVATEIPFDFKDLPIP